MEEMVTLKLSTYNEMIAKRYELELDIEETFSQLEEEIELRNELERKLDKFLEVNLKEENLRDNYWLSSFEKAPDEYYQYFFYDEHRLRKLYDVETLIGYVEFRITQNQVAVKEPNEVE